jgi:hypothetical protein
VKALNKIDRYDSHTSGNLLRPQASSLCDRASRLRFTRATMANPRSAEAAASPAGKPPTQAVTFSSSLPLMCVDCGYQAIQGNDWTTLDKTFYGDCDTKLLELRAVRKGSIYSSTSLTMHGEHGELGEARRSWRSPSCTTSSAVSST